MATRQINADTYEVDSDSSSTVYTVRWGTEGGPWWVCNCMSYVMRRNKGGGMGSPADCKHTRPLPSRQAGASTPAPSTGGNTIKRYFEFIGGGSRKFWEITYTPGTANFSVRFGPIGANGQTQHKPCAGVAAAAKTVDKLVNEKLNKGYQEVGGAVVAPAPVTVPVKLGTPVPAFAPPRAQKLVPMLADEVEMDTIATYAGDDRYVFEAKLDGQRVMIVIEKGKATAIGRNGQASQHQGRLQGGKHKVDLDRLGNRTLVLDTELMPDGTFWVFDMPRFVGGAGMTFDLAEPWDIRHKALELVFAAWNPDPTCYRLLPVARTTEDKVALVEHQKTNLGEGVIIKKTSSPYRPGVRGPDTLKAKFVHDADLIVTKVGVDGKNNACLSAFKGGSLVEVGKCSLNGKVAVKVGDVVVVRYLYLGNGDRIVQPRLMNVRTDKPHNQCTFDQLIGTNKEVVS